MASYTLNKTYLFIFALLGIASSTPFGVTYLSAAAATPAESTGLRLLKKRLTNQNNEIRDAEIRRLDEQNLTPEVKTNHTQELTDQYARSLENQIKEITEYVAKLYPNDHATRENAYHALYHMLRKFEYDPQRVGSLIVSCQAVETYTNDQGTRTIFYQLLWTLGRNSKMNHEEIIGLIRKISELGEKYASTDLYRFQVARAFMRLTNNKNFTGNNDGITRQQADNVIQTIEGLDDREAVKIKLYTALADLSVAFNTTPTETVVDLLVSSYSQERAAEEYDTISGTIDPNGQPLVAFLAENGFKPPYFEGDHTDSPAQQHYRSKLYKIFVEPALSALANKEQLLQKLTELKRKFDSHPRYRNGPTLTPDVHVLPEFVQRNYHFIDRDSALLENTSPAQIKEEFYRITADIAKLSDEEIPTTDNQIKEVSFGINRKKKLIPYSSITDPNDLPKKHILIQTNLVSSRLLRTLGSLSARVKTAHIIIDRVDWNPEQYRYDDYLNKETEAAFHSLNELAQEVDRSYTAAQAQEAIEMFEQGNSANAPLTPKQQEYKELLHALYIKPALDALSKKAELTQLIDQFRNEYEAYENSGDTTFSAYKGSVLGGAEIFYKRIELYKETLKTDRQTVEHFFEETVVPKISMMADNEISLDTKTLKEIAETAHSFVGTRRPDDSASPQAQTQWYAYYGNNTVRRLRMLESRIRLLIDIIPLAQSSHDLKQEDKGAFFKALSAPASIAHPDEIDQERQTVQRMLQKPTPQSVASPGAPANASQSIAAPIDSTAQPAQEPTHTLDPGVHQGVEPPLKGEATQRVEQPQTEPSQKIEPSPNQQTLQSHPAQQKQGWSRNQKLGALGGAAALIGATIGMGASYHSAKKNAQLPTRKQVERAINAGILRSDFSGKTVENLPWAAQMSLKFWRLLKPRTFDKSLQWFAARAPEHTAAAA